MPTIDLSATPKTFLIKPTTQHVSKGSSLPSGPSKKGDTVEWSAGGKPFVVCFIDRSPFEDVIYYGGGGALATATVRTDAEPGVYEYAAAIYYDAETLVVRDLVKWEPEILRNLHVDAGMEIKEAKEKLVTEEALAQELREKRTELERMLATPSRVYIHTSGDIRVGP